MLITRTSPLTGRDNTREIDVTPEQLSRWQGGSGLIQDVMPHLSADDREFLISGSTPEDWATMFPPRDEDGVIDMEWN